MNFCLRGGNPYWVIGYQHLSLFFRTPWFGMAFYLFGLAENYEGRALGLKFFWVKKKEVYDGSFLYEHRYELIKLCPSRLLRLLGD